MRKRHLRVPTVLAGDLPLVRTIIQRAGGAAHGTNGPGLCAFGLGETDKGIAAVDADGVALTAIRGPYRQNRERAGPIAEPEAQVAEPEAQSDGPKGLPNLLRPGLLPGGLGPVRRR